jgi:hypothetical protein
MGRILGFKKRREGERLLRQIASLETRLNHYSEEQKSCLWHHEAWQQLEIARNFLKNFDADGGWVGLQSAQRCLIKGMTLDEMEAVAVPLKEESAKLSAWRRDAIKTLLKEPPNINAVRLSEAFRIRDEYFNNQYHKTRISADQLIILFVISVAALVVALAAVTRVSQNDSSWAISTLLSVVAFGVLGSAFSVAQTVIGMANSSKVLEYVANYWATALRTLFGAVTGLAGYVIFSSDLIRLNLPENVNKMAVDLTVAFVFGYTGEKLINKISASFGSSSAGK